MQKLTCCDNYVIGFYHVYCVLRALQLFLSSKEIFQLYLIHFFFILYIIQMLLGFIRGVLLVLSVFIDDQEFADDQKDLLSTEDQMRKGKE